jgi:hypothetical protein
MGALCHSDNASVVDSSRAAAARKIRTHGVIVGFALTGIITELTSRFLLGGRSTSVWVSTTFNLNVWLPPNVYDGLDKIGWRALEVT